MSSFNPRRFPLKPPKVAGKLSRKAMETMVSRINEQLQELEEFLEDETQGEVTKNEPESHVSITRVSDPEREGANTQKVGESSPVPHDGGKFAVTPLESNAILERLEKLNQDSDALERIEKLTRQNRRLSILGSIFCILTFMFMMQLYRGNDLRFWPVARGTISGKPAGKVTSPPGAVAQTPAAPVPAAQKAAKPPEKPSLASEATPEPASKGASSVSGTQPKPAAPSIKYVGSLTSNKYHHPDCKWAQTIIPSKVRGFTSVAEATEAGYRQCPTCKPPLSDIPDSPPSGQN